MCTSRREGGLARVQLSGRDPRVITQVAVMLKIADDPLLVGGECLEAGAHRPQLGVRVTLAAPDGHQLAILDVA